VDLGGFEQASGALDEHVDAHPRQDQPVDGGGEDLRPGPAEGVPAGGGAGRQQGRAERQGDSAGVGEHMPRVGEQRQAAGDQCSGDLDGEDDRGDDECAGQRAPMLPGGGDVVCVAVAVSHQCPNVRALVPA
jgi:hypothetical protein